MTCQWKRTLAVTAVLTVAGAAYATIAGAAHANDYGNFDGYTLRVKLIGGAQYELLYTLIPQWEEATGAKVDIISRKSHFELDREMKQDIASGVINYCVFSNHTSFAPQYTAMTASLNDHISQDILDDFVPLLIEHATVDGELLQMPRHSDISNLYYIKSLYEDAGNKERFKAEYGYDLAPPDTWVEAADQAKFFANPPSFYGTHFAGKDEAISGRFLEMLIAEGGKLLNDDWTPAFNGEKGVRALDWFVDLYKAGAVPAGTTNYVWDELGLGFAAGGVAYNLDWGGWAAYFNGPDSKIAGDVGVTRAPLGSAGIRTGWSASHTFSMTKSCDNTEAAVSFLRFLTSYESQMEEARRGLLPTRSRVWTDVVEFFKSEGNDYMVEVFSVWGRSMAESAVHVPRIPEWGEISNALWPNLQAAVLGDMSSQDALDKAAEEVREVMEDAGYL